VGGGADHRHNIFAGRCEKMKDFIAFLDDNDRKVEAFVEVIEINQNFISFKSFQNNMLVIPMHRILKLKRKLNEDLEKRDGNYATKGKPKIL